MLEKEMDVRREEREVRERDHWIEARRPGMVRWRMEMDECPAPWPKCQKCQCQKGMCAKAKMSSLGINAKMSNVKWSWHTQKGRHCHHAGTRARHPLSSSRTAGSPHTHCHRHHARGTARARALLPFRSSWRRGCCWSALVNVPGQQWNETFQT